jgi:hypothetical protein
MHFSTAVFPRLPQVNASLVNVDSSPPHHSHFTASQQLQSHANTLKQYGPQCTDLPRGHVTGPQLTASDRSHMLWRNAMALNT